MKKKRKTMLERSIAENVRTRAVWRTVGANNQDAGYLVTQPDDINRPIALVPPSCPNALRRAFLIAKNPERHISPGHIIDYRDQGLLDSESPTSHWLYGMTCRVVGNEKEWAKPRPFCLWMLERLASQLPYAVREFRMRTGQTDDPHGEY